MAAEEEQQAVCSEGEESSDEDYIYGSDIDDDCQYVKSYTCEPEYSKKELQKMGVLNSGDSERKHFAHK